MSKFWLLFQNLAGHFVRVSLLLAEICRTHAVGQKNFIVSRCNKIFNDIRRGEECSDPPITAFGLSGCHRIQPAYEFDLLQLRASTPSPHITPCSSTRRWSSLLVCLWLAGILDEHCGVHSWTSILCLKKHHIVMKLQVLSWIRDSCTVLPHIVMNNEWKPVQSVRW